VFKNKKHHWDKDLSFDNNPLYVFLVKEKFKQQFHALKSRRNKHFPVFLSRISPSLNSARMRREYKRAQQKFVLVSQNRLFCYA